MFKPLGGSRTLRDRLISEELIPWMHDADSLACSDVSRVCRASLQSGNTYQGNYSMEQKCILGDVQFNQCLIQVNIE